MAEGELAYRKADNFAKLCPNTCPFVKVFWGDIVFAKVTGFVFPKELFFLRELTVMLVLGHCFDV